MSVRKFCCLIVLLINLSCTVYMKTTSNFVCADDTDNAAVTRRGKTFAKAAKVHRTLGPLRDLIKRKGHQRVAATPEPPATTEAATKTDHTTTAVTKELATTKALPTTPSTETPSTNPTTIAPFTTKATTAITTHTTITTTTKTSPAITKTISAPVTTKTRRTIKDNKKKLGISSPTKVTNYLTPISKALFSNGKWKLPDVAPLGTWLF